MSFEPIPPHGLAVFDTERGLTLRSATGGSDGRQGFVLEGDDVRVTFDAYTRMRAANAVERQARPEIGETVVWHLSNAGPALPEMDQRQTYDVLAEAMLAQRGPRHDEVNWTVVTNSIPRDI